MLPCFVLNRSHRFNHVHVQCTHSYVYMYVAVLTTGIGYTVTLCSVHCTCAVGSALVWVAS